MDIDGFRVFIGSVSWIFARTMPEQPHEYTLRKAAPDDAVFNDAVIAIRNQGAFRYYRNHPYIQWDVDGWSYWTMGAAADQTMLINRARI